MKRWHVFDCTVQVGVSASFWGPKWLARLAASFLMWRTGRLHDYLEADAFARFYGTT